MRLWRVGLRISMDAPLLPLDAGGAWAEWFLLAEPLLSKVAGPVALLHLQSQRDDGGDTCPHPSAARRCGRCWRGSGKHSRRPSAARVFRAPSILSAPIVKNSIITRSPPSAIAPQSVACRVTRFMSRNCARMWPGTDLDRAILALVTDPADVIGVEDQGVGFRISRPPRVPMIRSWAILQLVGCRVCCESPCSKLICVGPRRQVPGVAPAPTREASHGISGHFSSSTRALPNIGMPPVLAAPGGVVGAVTETSGRSRMPAARRRAG